MLGKLSRRFVAALAFTLLLFAIGCTNTAGDNAPEPSGTNGNGTSSSNETENANQSDESRDSNEKFKISVAPYQLAPLSRNAPVIDYWNDMFHVELDIWNIEAKQYDEILSLRIASGEIPDVLSVNKYADFTKYAKQGVIAEIPEDMLQKHAPHLYATYLKYDKDGEFNYGRIDGKIYGINQLNFRGNYHLPLVWRGDWLENVGIDKVPETLEEFEAAMYKFAKEDPDGNGKDDTYGLSESGMTVVYGAFGYLPFSIESGTNKDVWSVRDGKLVNGAVQPEMKQALALLNKWYQDGVIDPEFITGENTGGRATLTQAFVTGRIGFTSHGAFIQWNPEFPGKSQAGANRVELAKLNPEAAEKLLFSAPPIGPDGKRGAYAQEIIQSNIFALGKQLEKEPAKMARILEILDYICFSSYEHYLDGLYGPGNWQFVDGLATPNAEVADPVEAAKIGAHNVSVWLANIDWKMKDFEPYMDWLEENHMATGNIWNELTAPLPSEGKYLAELTKLRDEAYISIITGDKPLDSFDAFVEEWRRLGGEQLEKEANEWYASAKANQ